MYQQRSMVGAIKVLGDELSNTKEEHAEVQRQEKKTDYVKQTIEANLQKPLNPCQGHKVSGTITVFGILNYWYQAH